MFSPQNYTTHPPSPKESESRLQAFAVMARIGTFNAAVTRDAEKTRRR